MSPRAEPSQWAALGTLAQVGVAFVASTVLGLAGGYYADRWLGSSPWGLLVGLGIGIAAGFLNLFRALRAAERIGDTDDA